MKLTAQQVFDATPIVAQIIREGRKLPQKGAYRMAQMFKGLQPEFNTISERRDALITAYGHMTEVNGQEVNGVPPDKAAEFFAAWKEIAEEVIEVHVEPIPLAKLDLGDEAAGSVSAGELIALGDLVAE